MSASKKKSKKKKVESPGDRMKYEIAKELGLAERVKKFGWGSLTAAETGRIGGIITTRKKAGKGAIPPGSTMEG